MAKYMEKEKLEKLHNVEVEILDEFNRICNKHNLQYFLSYGTLLGAVRHQGFIPWDDDLDVSMPREDYEKFIEIAEDELNKEYYIDNKNTNDKYYLNFTKLRKKNTVFEQDFQVNYDGPKGIWVDIFPIDEIKKENSKLLFIQNKLDSTIFRICHYKSGFFLSKKLLLIKKLIGKLTIFSKKRLLKWQDKVLKWQDGKNYDYWCTIVSLYDNKSDKFRKEDFLPAKILKFEGKEYKVPNNYEKVLTQLYGDYMKIPPEEQRVTHNPVRLEFDKDCDTNLFVVGHKDFDFPNIEGYKKILVGATKNRKNVNGVFDFYDDEKDNISNKNGNYCELTALYWIWKNVKNIKYLGLCHYRRIFSKSRVSENSKLFLRVPFIQQVLKDYDVILPKKVDVGKRCEDIYSSFTANSIKAEDLENTRKIMQERYPDYLEKYNQILNDRKMSFTNMLITDNDTFEKYCEWLFDILGEVEKITDYSNRTDQQLRVFGYISEILLNVWVEKNALKVKYIKTVKLDESHNAKYYIKLILEKMRLY